MTPVTISELVKLTEERDAALLQWRAVKRLNGPCTRVVHSISQRYIIGAVTFTLEQRGNSLCTRFSGPNHWCATCRPAFEHWKKYLVLAHRVQKEMEDG